MDLNGVMDALGVRLGTIAGLRVFTYPPDKVTPPAAIVAYPDAIEYDATYAGGSDRAVFGVHVLVGAVSDRASRVTIGPYANRAGAQSVKAALEADVSLAGAAKTLRVQAGEFTRMTVAGVEYLAASFDVEVYA